MKTKILEALGVVNYSAEGAYRWRRCKQVHTSQKTRLDLIWISILFPLFFFFSKLFPFLFNKVIQPKQERLSSIMVRIISNRLLSTSKTFPSLSRPSQFSRFSLKAIPSQPTIFKSKSTTSHAIHHHNHNPMSSIRYKSSTSTSSQPPPTPPTSTPSLGSPLKLVFSITFITLTGTLLTIKFTHDPTSDRPLQRTSLPTLFRSLFVYSICSVPFVVDAGPTIIEWCRDTSIPGVWKFTEWVVRNTFFKQVSYNGGKSMED